MKTLFLDSSGRLRNGWWILVFIALLLASRVAYTPASRVLQEAGVPPDALEPLRFGFLLLVTWACTRLRAEPLSSVGFVLDRRWGREFGSGTLLGIASVMVVALLIWIAGGVRFAPDPARSLAVLAHGAWIFLFVALFEETLFRGFAFQRLVDGAGAPIALIASGLLFSTSHWGNPDMHGATLAWATTELFLGAVLLGLAWLRTRSLALPVGLHLGWNWALGSLLGFDVSGFEQSGWFRPELLGRPDWMTGGAFGPEASVFAVVVDVLLVALLWRWKGSASGSVRSALAQDDAGPQAPAHHR